MKVWLRGIRLRLLATIIGCAAIAILFLAATAMGMAYLAEDRVLLARLEVAEKHHRRLLAQQSAGEPALASGDALIIISQQPAIDLPDIATALMKLEPGIHEWLGDEQHSAIPDGEDRLIAVRDIPPHGRFWYVYSTTLLESNSQQQFRDMIMLLLAASGALLICVLSITAWGKWLFNPLQRLQEVAQNSSDDQPSQLSQEFADDEIGAVAHAFDQAQHRLLAFLQRERNFTRDVSHEFRTPITVIEGALDLMALQTDTLPPSVQRAADRMRRACRTMRLQIDAFLTLARETDPRELEIISIAEALQTAIAQQHDAHAEAASIFRISSMIDTTVHAPRAAVMLVIDNLLRNALQHASGGQIEITLVAGTLVVCNYVDAASVPHDPTQPFVSGGGSTGLGLSIVSELCQRCGWDCQVAHENNEFSVTIHFPASSD